MKLAKIGVIGGGAWGTALAQVAAGQGGDVLLWALEAEVVAAINAAHENDVYLPGIPLSPSIRAVADLAEMEDRDALLIVTPAQHLRPVLTHHIPIEEFQAGFDLMASGQCGKVVCTWH